MRLVVGLGNPGRQYERTRHNAGFWVVDELADRFAVARWQSKWRSLIAECRIGSEKVLLCKPQTYMNRSGQAVAEVCAFYSELAIDKDLVIIYDDMDFALGRLKLRNSGSAGGHNGMKSIIESLGTETFARVRFGIGRPEPGLPVMDYVLSPVPKDQGALVRETIRLAADAIETACLYDFARAMNQFNSSAP